MARLPSAYREVKYIESTGTQTIDTGLVPNENLDFEIKIDWLGTGYGILGVGTPFFWLWSNFWCYGSATNIRITPNEIATYHSEKNILFKNGVQYASTSVESITTTNHITMFSLNGNFTSNTRVYYCKIKDSDGLVRDFVPCYRKSDNVIGLYDLVNDVFYTNAGTGTFLKGNDVFEEQELNCYIINNELPSAYQRVEYISAYSLIAGTFSIDTGVEIKNSSGFSIDWKFDGIQQSSGNYSAIIGGINAWVGGLAMFYVANYGLEFISGSNMHLENIASPLERHLFELKNFNKCYIDNQLVNTLSTQTYTNANEHIRIFFIPPLAEFATASCYDCEIYGLNGEIIRKLIPCYRKADNTIGLYDSINDVFYINSGTGVFGKGNNIYTEPQKLIPYILKPALPDAFQEVEYLEGTGEQYIKDIFDCGENTIEFDIMPIDMSAGFNNWLFGLYDPSGAGLEAMTYGITISRADLYQSYAGTVTPARAAEGVREKYTFVSDTGVYSTKKIGLFFETGYPNRTFKGRVYSFGVKRTSDGQLIRDLVTCYRKADNVLGVYDLVTGVFYVNGGTGTFLKGRDLVSRWTKQKIKLKILS